MAEVQLEISKTLHEKREQHGFKFGHYEKYRKYCGRKVHKLRKINRIQQFTATHKVRTLPTEAFNKPSYLEVLLFESERALSFASACEEKEQDSPNEKRRKRRKLKKAISHVHKLREFCFKHSSQDDDLPFKFSFKTWTEILVYHSYISGFCFLKLGKYRKAYFYLKTAKPIYETLVDDCKCPDMKKFYQEFLEDIDGQMKKCLYFFKRNGILSDVETSSLYLEEAKLNKAYLDVLHGKQIEMITSLLTQTNIDNIYKIVFFNSERTFSNPPEWLKFIFDKISGFFNLNTKMHDSFNNKSKPITSSSDLIYERKLSFSSFYFIPGFSPYINMTDDESSFFGPIINPCGGDIELTKASANQINLDHAAISKNYDDLLFEVDSMHVEFDKMLKISENNPGKQHTEWLKLYFQYTATKIKISRNFYLIYQNFSKMIVDSKYDESIDQLFEFSDKKKSKWWLKEKDDYRPEIFIRLYDSICMELNDLSEITSNELLYDECLADSIKSTFYYCQAMKCLLTSLLSESSNNMEEALSMQKLCLNLLSGAHASMQKWISIDSDGVNKMQSWFRNMQTRHLLLELHKDESIQKTCPSKDIYSMIEKNETINLKQTEKIEFFPSVAPFNATMIKPIFYDIAGTHIEFPLIENIPLTEKKKETIIPDTVKVEPSKPTGITGFVKNLFWGS